MRLRRLADALMVATLAGGLAACTELVAAAAGSEVEKSRHEHD